MTSGRGSQHNCVEGRRRWGFRLLKKIVDGVLRVVLGAAKQVRRGIWYFTRPETFGAHAIALTPRGTIVLVRLRYARGWFAPGGGRKPGEDAAAAVLRELREEIGMTAHGEVRLAAEVREAPDHKNDLASIFIVRDVEYRPPRWSIEIEEVREAALDALPRDLAPSTRGWIAAVRPYL